MKKSSIVKGGAVDTKALTRAIRTQTLTVKDYQAAERILPGIVELCGSSAAALETPKAAQRKKGGHEADEKLIGMLYEAARKKSNDPRNGFVTSMHTSDETGELDGLAIYAWGESAAVLAENLKFRPQAGERLELDTRRTKKPEHARLLPPATEQREIEIREEIQFPGLLYGGPRDKKS